jgi:hypothetical protein
MGWSDAPHRVLHHKIVIDCEQAGRPAPGNRPGDGEVIGTSKVEGTLVRDDCNTPQADAEIVHGIDAEACAMLKQFGQLKVGILD